MKISCVFPFLLLLVITLVYVGCKKDKNDPSSNSAVTTSLNLKVMDKSASPLAGVEVKCYNRTGFTSSDGTVRLSDIGIPEADKNRMIINLKKNTYFESSVGVKPNAGNETYFEAVLSEAELAGTVNNNTGGIVANSSGTIYMDFPPNSLAYDDGTSYSGDANIYTAYYTPDDNNFALSMPGGPDMLATNINGQEGSMISYGAISVEAKTPEMKSLQLTGMKSSNISVNTQIPNTMLAESPVNVPIWRLDEETAVWKEIGTATKQGNRYAYELDHFSSINVDEFIFFDGATVLIEGDVCDDSLNPLPFARVDADQRTVYANEAGHFEVYLPSNRVYSFESKYCTKIEGPFSIGEDNYVDLCCEGNEAQGFFNITVDGTYQGSSIDDEFQFTNHGYFFLDTIMEGYTYDNILEIYAGGIEQYWGFNFMFANITSSGSIGTFTGSKTYSIYSIANPNYYDVIFLGQFTPNGDTTNAEIFWCETGSITITDYEPGGLMAGHFNMSTSGGNLNCTIDGEFEMYEYPLYKYRNQDGIKKDLMNMESYFRQKKLY